MDLQNQNSDNLEHLMQRIAELETQLHRTQEQLSVTETDLALFKALMDSLPQNIFSKDLNGKFTYANYQYCATEGKTLDEILGKTDFDLHPEHLAIKYRADDQEVIHDQLLIELEEEHQPLDGPKSVVKVIKAPLYNADKDVIGTIGVFWDITEEKAAEAHRLAFSVEKERIRILQQFIEGALHEFRTPMSTIQVHLYLLKQAISEELQEHVEAIERQSEDILRLVEALSTITQLDHNVMIPTVRVNINTLIQDVFTNKKSEFTANDLKVNLSLAPNLPTILGSPQELTIALNCILDNAISHTPAGGEISITSKYTDQDVSASIQDTGSGIHPKNLPHIFERFFREDTARTTRGLGLGLPIAKTIVTRHHGRIDVESVLGEGSTFTIVLPITDDDATTSE